MKNHFCVKLHVLTEHSAAPRQPTAILDQQCDHDLKGNLEVTMHSTLQVLRVVPGATI